VVAVTDVACEGRPARTLLDEVVAAVKKKKELSGLADTYVREKVEETLTREKKISEKLERSTSFKAFSRSSEFKLLKRLVREELRKVYGVFQKPGKDESEKLKAHQSSAERLPYYREVYRRIFAITGEPRSILDLGCGANPYSYGKLGCRPFFVAVDLPNDELERIAAFFKDKGIEGEVFGLDLVAEQELIAALTATRPFDVAFLFKLLDSLETIERNISGKLLDAITATWLVVSFPTVSIGGRKVIRKERRAWFEKLLSRKGWYWEEFSIENEVFYVVLKDPDRLAEARYDKHAGLHEAHYKQYHFEDELEKIRRMLPAGTILDLGCGIGRDAAMFSEAGYEVVGIDRAEQLLTIAEKRVPNATFVAGDLRALPFDEETFDLIWSLASLVHFYDEDVLRALRECHRVLKKKGILFITVKEGQPQLAKREGGPVFFRNFKKEELLDLIRKAGFSVLSTSRSRQQRTNVHKRRKDHAGHEYFYRVYARKVREE